MDFEDFEYFGDHRRFIVARLGGTGSAWFVKLLNAHPEVFCRHEGVIERIYPRTSYDEGDIIAYLASLAANSLHGAYSASGDVGSIWMKHAVFAPREEFTTGVLVRHPVRILATRLRRVSKNENSHFTDIDEEHLRHSFSLQDEHLLKSDLYFLNDIFYFKSSLETLSRVDITIHFESLLEPEKAQSLIQRLTGVEYPKSLIEQHTEERVNATGTNESTIKEIFENFSGRQQDWYQRYLHQDASKIGYTIDRG